MKAMGVSRDGKYQVAGTDDAKLNVWKTAEEALLATTTVSGPIRSLAVGAEAAKIIVACNDKIVRNYALLESGGKPSLQLTQQGHGHTDAIAAVSLTDEDRVMVSVSLDRTIKRWLATSNAARLTLAKEGGSAYALDFSPNGKLLAVASGDKTARTWKTDTGEQAAIIIGHPGQVAAIAFQNAEQFATASSGGIIKICGAAEGVQERTDPQLGQPADPQRLERRQHIGVSRHRPNDPALGHRESNGRPNPSRAQRHDLPSGLQSHRTVRLTTLDETGQLFVWDPMTGGLLYHQQLPLRRSLLHWAYVGRRQRVVRGRRGSCSECCE